MGAGWGVQGTGGSRSGPRVCEIISTHLGPTLSEVQPSSAQTAFPLESPGRCGTLQSCWVISAQDRPSCRGRSWVWAEMQPQGIDRGSPTRARYLPRPPRYLHPVNLGNSERSGRETSRNTGCLSCSATSKALLGWEMTVALDPSHTPEPRPHHLAQAAQPGAAGGAVMVPMSQMGKLRPGAISEPRSTLELKLFFCLFF